MNTTFDAGELLETVRQKAPVVHHLTNWVTIYDCAQVVKTLGASPVMAHAEEEVSEMTQIAAALVLNIGTLTVKMVDAMKCAARAANARSIPVVLDVCGAGATSLRDAKVNELLAETKIDIIKGNASEIARVAGEAVRTRGVDTTEIAADLKELAHKLAVRRQATVVITGPTDVIADVNGASLVKNGHVMMTHVVGTGCMAASVIGTFAAVEPNYRRAAVSGLACYEIAAELAAKKSSGPISFKQSMFDCLYQLDRATVERLQRIEL